ARLNHRLRRLVDALTAQPTAALPQACAGMVDPAYRFFDNPHVRPDDIRAAHYADTLSRWPPEDGPLLLASDTTRADYSSQPPPARRRPGLPTPPRPAPPVLALDAGVARRRPARGPARPARLGA